VIEVLYRDSGTGETIPTDEVDETQEVRRSV
jgi:hypothetical protein